MRAGGTQTSSMISELPCERIAPTIPCIPSRTSQKISVSSRSRVKRASSSSSQPATAASARSSRPSSSATSVLRNSTSSAAPSGGSSRQRSGTPGSE